MWTCAARNDKGLIQLLFWTIPCICNQERLDIQVYSHFFFSGASTLHFVQEHKIRPICSTTNIENHPPARRIGVVLDLFPGSWQFNAWILCVKKKTRSYQVICLASRRKGALLRIWSLLAEESLTGTTDHEHNWRNSMTKCAGRSNPFALSISAAQIRLFCSRKSAV